MTSWHDDPCWLLSLLAGHTAHLVTNYGDTRHPGTRLLAALTIASVEVSAQQL